MWTTSAPVAQDIVRPGISSNAQIAAATGIPVNQTVATMASSPVVQMPTMTTTTMSAPTVVAGQSDPTINDPNYFMAYSNIFKEVVVAYH